MKASEGESALPRQRFIEKNNKKSSDYCNYTIDKSAGGVIIDTYSCILAARKAKMTKTERLLLAQLWRIKMKRRMLVYLVLIVIASLFLIGCNKKNINSFDNYSLITYNNKTANNYYIPTDNKLFAYKTVKFETTKEHVKDELNIELLSSVSHDFLLDLSEEKTSENPSYEASYVLIPTYNTYFNPEDYFVCIYYDEVNVLDSKIYNYSLLNDYGDDYKSLMIKEAESDTTGISNYLGWSNIDSLNSNYCFKILKECLVNCPDFTIVGIVFETAGYPTLIPVGIDSESNCLKYYKEGRLHDFKCIDKVHTFEEGRASWITYKEKCDEIVNSIPRYNWPDSEVDLEWTQWMTRITPPEDRYFNYSEIDKIVSVPLLNENEEQFIYLLHICYIKNQYAGECLVKCVESTMPRTKCEWIVVYDTFEYDENGSNIPVNSKSLYLQTMENYDLTNVCGVMYKDGSFIPVT